MILAPQSLKEEIDKLKAENEKLKAKNSYLENWNIDKLNEDYVSFEDYEKLKEENEDLKVENEQLKNDISDYETCIPEHYNIVYPHNIANIVDEFEATIDGLKTEVLTLEEEKKELKELEEQLYDYNDHNELLQRWIEDRDWYYPTKEFIDKVCGGEDKLKKWYYEIYEIVDYSKEDVDCYFTRDDRIGMWVRLKDGRECRDND